MRVLAVSSLLPALAAVSLAQESARRPGLPPAFVAGADPAAAALFDLRDGGARLGFERGAFWVRPAGARAAVRWTVAGGRDVAPEPLGAPRARFHFLLGDDPAGWRRDVPAYAGVRYAGILEGVDLVVHARGGEVEYDLELAPGVALDGVRLEVEGADALELGPEGELVLRAGASTLRQRAPRSSERLPDGGARALASRFVLLGPRSFGFAAPERDPAAPLVVDPTLVYTRYVGGAAAEDARGVASDPFGNVYVVGSSASEDFPRKGGVGAPAASRQACVFKLDAQGELVWASFLGGTCDDEASAIAVDADGGAVVVGRTKSDDFPTSAGAWRPYRAGLWDAFAARLSPDGSRLAYATFLGGADEEEATGVALGPRGDALVVGTTRSSDFPCTSHALKKRLDGISDAFVVALDGRGAVPIFATLLGGTREDRACAVARDARGHALVAGVTHSLDFPSTRGAFDEVRDGTCDAFVTCLGVDGGALVWSSFLGGSGEDGAQALAWTGDSVVVGGWSASADLPGAPGAPRGRAAFVARLSGSGAALEWMRVLDGRGDERCNAVAPAADGSVWAAGETDSSDLPLRDATQPAAGGGRDGWLARLEARDGAPAFLTYVGGAGDETLRGVAPAERARRVTVVGSANAVLPSARGLLGAGQEPSDDALIAVLASGPCGLAAAREIVGRGCGASMTCDLPRLGTRVAFLLRDAPPGAEGVLLWSPPAEAPLRLEGWCDVPLDLRRLERPAAFTTAEDGTARIVLDLPADPSLCGRTLVFQALVLAPGRGPLAFGALGQALALTLGG